MSQTPTTQSPTSGLLRGNTLHRKVGLLGAVMMGLGSILGTGVFVSIGIAAGATGPAVILAILVAAMVATFNGLSSAQLAANHPVSGGTYEYGYRWLTPWLGFSAGWMFLCAKSASAATAALGFAGYVAVLLRIDYPLGKVGCAAAMVCLMTLLVAGGMRRSNRANMMIVSLTLLSLITFVVCCFHYAYRTGDTHLFPFFHPVDSGSPLGGFLEATALMFVAFTGYGRIATLGEEVIAPQRTIPQAVIATLIVSSLLYVAVGLAAVMVTGTEELAADTQQQAAPLESVAQRMDSPLLVIVVTVGAVTAMMGALLNLILGLSRVALAMGRRGDMPNLLATISGKDAIPRHAVFAVGILVGLLTLVGNIKTTWSFSAFTVLIYYAITNLAATRLSDSERLYPRWIPWLGLTTCLILAFWVTPRIWLAGSAVLVAGLTVQGMMRALRTRL
jgi:basic amino acid/polyamine antiporter, APA family